MEKLHLLQPQATRGGPPYPPAFGSVEEEYWALKESAGLMDLSHRGRLIVRGKDAARLLQGMVSNDVKALASGRGMEAFFLDVQGHIQSDARIFRIQEDTFWLELEPLRVEVVKQILDKHIIADDVELALPGPETACMAIEGPCALEPLREAIGFDPPGMLPLEHMELRYDSEPPLRFARASLSGEFGFWLWGHVERLADVWQKAARAGAPLGARPVGEIAVEACRIEAGIPRYGADIDDKTLPQETGQMHALSFTKGCYLGQEIVERVRSRGHVNRRLAGLLLEDRQELRPGEELLTDDQTAGRITSAAYSYGLRRTIALGMFRREFAEPGTQLATASGLPAEIVALPFFYPMARSRTA
jgi:folate-binding protein YgfZ